MSSSNINNIKTRNSSSGSEVNSSEDSAFDITKSKSTPTTSSNTKKSKTKTVIHNNNSSGRESKTDSDSAKSKTKKNMLGQKSDIKTSCNIPNIQKFEISIDRSFIGLEQEILTQNLENITKIKKQCNNKILNLLISKPDDELLIKRLLTLVTQCSSIIDNILERSKDRDRPQPIELQKFKFKCNHFTYVEKTTKKK